jgi:transglutaminase-like putative cysteine protease
MQPWLRSTAFVQADDTSMVRTAGTILGDQLQASQAAVLLESWVYRTLEKVPVAGVPSATEVLASKRGDCNEHTTLYTALARSVGLPTRLAAGIVYSESIFADGAFYYHAWPEVWLGDRWLAVDPTFGQAPADATHLKLVEGELDKQTELMGVIGRLRLSVVEVAQ